ncbi:MAG TPA: hypothetical protein VMH80_18135 [Bryobacteraceae bacterium]|nr:hypothetical protein [Bryobacteraceae bacterium]
MRILFCALVLAAYATAQPVIGAAGYSSPTPLPVAPGQIISLFVQNISGPAPSVSDVSAVFHQNSDIPMPVLNVQAICAVPGETCAATIRGITVQIPYGIQTLCPLCANPLLPSGYITVSIHGVSSGPLGVQPLADQVHFLTQCDVFIGNPVSLNNGGLPCAPMITHADGTMVSATKPASSGEELVAYATGLGETNPPLTTGKPAPAASPTQTVFSIDFDYRPNALATKPPPVPTGEGIGLTLWELGPPLFTGATAGFIGLYQINFVVPPAPAGLPPCVDTTTLPPGANVVQSNLTVSVGSNFSFDGAGICVQPGS